MHVGIYEYDIKLYDKKTNCRKFLPRTGSKATAFCRGVQTYLSIYYVIMIIKSCVRIPRALCAGICILCVPIPGAKPIAAF